MTISMSVQRKFETFNRIWIDESVPQNKIMQYAHLKQNIFEGENIVLNLALALKFDRQIYDFLVQRNLQLVILLKFLQ